tara:strand:+ start:6453 stop:7514 length:1062 start_codon:yes stop_codon:yes gene_type:complete
MKKPFLKINNEFFHNKNPLIIAEIGNNHQGSLQKCKDLFLAAKNSGANAVKLQKRTNKKIYTKKAFDEVYNSENSFAKTYGLHREYLEFGKSEYIELKKYAKKLNIIFFATAFDIDSANFLNDNIDLPAFKIASADILNFPLIKHVASFNKPMILSTGFSDLKQIEKVYKILTKKKVNFSFLQCTAAYPCKSEDLNLKVIKTFREKFKNILIGFSSHHNGISLEVVAYMLGARIFEKHFTLNRSWKGTDHSFSLTPLGLSKMVRDIKRIDIALGSNIKKPLDVEKKPVLKMQKSLVASRDLKKGTVITLGDIDFKSPGGGIDPSRIKEIVGKKILNDLNFEEKFMIKYFKKVK